MKKYLSLVMLCCFLVPISLSAIPPHAQVASTPPSGIFQQLAVTIFGFYSVLLSSTSNTEGTSLSAPSPATHEDGYILSLDGHRAHISLSKKDGIQQGMLLEVYRPKVLHDVISDHPNPIEESLGLGLVVEVFEETSILYFSNFEVKVVVERPGQLPTPMIEVSDRVKRPDWTAEQNMSQLSQTLPSIIPLPESVRIVTVNGNQIYLDFSGAAAIDDELTLIKAAKEITHPVNGQRLVIGEERQATGRVFDLKETSTGVLLPPDTSGYFIPGDTVSIVKK